VSRPIKAVFLGLIVGMLGAAVSLFRFSYDIEEDLGLGLLFALRGVAKVPSDVVVVSIDRASSERLNVPENPDRWPRSLYARLVETLARKGARVIIFDVYFVEPRIPDEDRLFSEAVKKAGNVVLAEHLKTKEVGPTDPGGTPAGDHKIVTSVKPIDALLQSAVATAPFVLPRMPVKVNQYWTFQAAAGDLPTFPVVAFQLYALPVYPDFLRLLEKVSPDRAKKLPPDAASAIKEKGAVRLIRDIREIFESDPSMTRKMTKELAQSNLARDVNKHRLLRSLVKMYGDADRRYLNYYGPPRTVNTVPFYQALQLHEGADAGKALDLNGKAVFVGLSEILLTERLDSFYTVFSQANGVFISGVEIAATAFSNLLEDAAVKPISSSYYLVIILMWGIVVGFVSRMASTVVAALAAVGLSLFYLVAALYPFKTSGAWYPIVIPLFLQTPLGFFGAVLWNYFETNKERQNVRKALAYYVPDEVVDQLARNIVDMKRGGKTVYGACLFTDAAGYTQLSEMMGPRELSDFMHKYFEAVFEPVKQNGGLVVNLKGDSILAIWKAARPEAGLRKQACRAALGVAQAVDRFNRSFATLHLPTRVGVHAGQIFLGNIGAAEHYEYGPTGDTVNTASRMDGLNKYLGTEILVSDEAIRELDGFTTREVGTFRLKGKAQPIVVHELLCREEECRDKMKERLALFSQALRTFKRQSWDEAKDKFRRSIDAGSGEDGPANFYLKLCEQYRKNPPEGPWEGIIDLEEK
jgi:adenylate cyclase